VQERVEGQVAWSWRAVQLGALNFFAGRYDTVLAYFADRARLEMVVKRAVYGVSTFVRLHVGCVVPMSILAWAMLVHSRHAVCLHLVQYSAV
jgi:hypothetical protein